MTDLWGDPPYGLVCVVALMIVIGWGAVFMVNGQPHVAASGAMVGVALFFLGRLSV